MWLIPDGGPYSLIALRLHFQTTLLLIPRKFASALSCILPRVISSNERILSWTTDDAKLKTDGTRYSAYLRHASLKSTQCRYRRTARTSPWIFLQCIVSSFFTLSLLRFSDNWTTQTVGALILSKLKQTLTLTPNISKLNRLFLLHNNYIISVSFIEIQM